jgi:hypothetical protein
VDLVSPALSASVFRLGSGSLSTQVRPRNHKSSRSCLQGGPNPRFSEGGGNIFEIGFERALLCDSESSARPFPGDGILLGGRI